jgi:hypothetical protein
MTASRWKILRAAEKHPDPRFTAGGGLLLCRELTAESNRSGTNSRDPAVVPYDAAASDVDEGETHVA